MLDSDSSDDTELDTPIGDDVDDTSLFASAEDEEEEEEEEGECEECGEPLDECECEEDDD